ncbi:Conserved_hypothetical protein [Hexamita inflata]|uniref:Uncharacterized protein n=1 Tax=Hexamita inflata TaxID=28002 RepID=A0AA86UFJ1_9EUKA|nr:Conserved hypothetical protein [Hexamita inflata]
MDPIIKFTQLTTEQEAAEFAKNHQFNELSGQLVAGATKNYDQIDEYLKKYIDIQLAEDIIRHNYAQKVEQKTPVVDVYANYDRFVTKILPENQAVYCTLSTPTINEHSIVAEAEFNQNLQHLMQDIFKGIDMTNVILAGGSVLACLMPGFGINTYAEKVQEDLKAEVLNIIQQKTGVRPNQVTPELLEHGLNGYYTSDLDLFVYGLTQKQAQERVASIIKQIIENNGADVIMRSSQAITILGKGKHRDIQIVFRLYKDPAEVVMGFDIDCVAVYYDFALKKAFCTERSLFSLNTRTNVLNQTRRSTSYGTRLIKYAHRGFAIVVPGFTRDCVLAEEIPQVSKNYKWTGAQQHQRTSHEDLYFGALVQLQTSWSYHNDRTFVQNELNMIIQEDLTFVGIKASNARSNIVHPYFCSLKTITKLFQTIAILQMNLKPENKIQNLESKFVRQTLASGRQNTKRSKATAKRIIEDEKLNENAVENAYLVKEEKEVLSYQFAKTHDYCTPSSFGFHSEHSLEYAKNNPRHLNNLYIGSYDSKYGIKFLEENPGTQMLLTSSFHPTNEFNYYGDLRLAFGPQVFTSNFQPKTEAEFKYKLFFFNHFTSVPGYLSSIFGAGREEKTKYAKIQTLQSELEEIKKMTGGFQIQIMIRAEVICKQIKQLAQDCCNLAQQRQFMQQKLEKSVVADNLRQLINWQWYLSQEEMAEIVNAKNIEKSLQVQYNLAKATAEDIMQFKQKGAMVAHYGAVQNNAETQLQALNQQLNVIYTDLISKGTTSAPIFGLTVDISCPYAKDLLKLIQTSDLMDKLQIQLFEQQPNVIEYLNDQCVLKGMVQLQLTGTEPIQQIMNSFNGNMLNQVQLMLTHDFSSIQVKFNIKNVRQFQETINEAASFDLVQTLLKQFEALLEADYQIDMRTESLYVLNDKLLMVKIPGPNKFESIKKENTKQFCESNLGLNKYLIEYALSHECKSSNIEIPSYMLKEMVNRSYSKNVEQVVATSDSVSDMLYVFRVLKQYNCDMKPFINQIEMSQNAFFDRLFSQIENVYTIPLNQLYLLGRALSYALNHTLKIKAQLPVQLFRLFADSSFKYSKIHVDVAKLDLLSSKIDFENISKVTVNQILYKREELDNDLFTVQIANSEFMGKHQAQHEAILNGFTDFGGLSKVLTGLNGVQLMKVVQ